MIRFYRHYKQRLREEHGAILVSTIFFLFCLGGLLSLLLFLEQSDLLEMKTQHTADIVSKGARAAGKWEYVDSEGERQLRLFATTDKAVQDDADIVRGAREEAAILWQLNSPALASEGKEARAIHQKGEKAYLYRQGIYHVRVEAGRSIPIWWGELDVQVRRVSQSGIYE
ncbi:hypothetical protein [Brevibacillus sp. SIMBA_040]|uniref:hypothetical protein n=1 Tax=unclassified Brevibacillus TaxID=2684853 RepID=UPI003978E6EE